MRATIIQKFNEALEQTGTNIHLDKISDDAVLIETGLDTLGFAVL
tara:strand:+ start:154 stop:288 length:135 start_codon:yes stop_codon:yes gene_type:complete